MKKNSIIKSAFILLVFLKIIRLNAQDYAGSAQSGNWDLCATWDISKLNNILGVGAYINEGHNVNIPVITARSALIILSSSSSITFDNSDANWQVAGSPSGVPSCIAVGGSQTLSTQHADGSCSGSANNSAAYDFELQNSALINPGYELSSSYTQYTRVKEDALTYTINIAGTYKVEVGSYLEVPKHGIDNAAFCWITDYDIGTRVRYRTLDANEDFLLDFYSNDGDGWWRGNSYQCSNQTSGSQDYEIFGETTTSGSSTGGKYLPAGTFLWTRVRIERYGNTTCRIQFFLRHHMKVIRVS